MKHFNIKHTIQRHDSIQNFASIGRVDLVVQETGKFILAETRNGTLSLDFYADIFRKMKSSLHAFKILLGFMDRLNASILNFELFMHIYKILKCR